jgi:galactokinase
VPGETHAASAPSRAGPGEVRAFAPGRVNLIGEHTDYNCGLALPFAIAEGVTVRGRADQRQRILARALDLGEEDELPLTECDSRLAGGDPLAGWRAFVRGVAAELSAAGVAVHGAELEIQGTIPRGAGLSSSAALAVALGLALLGLAGAELDPRSLARLCSRVENDWVGARTGLLDQLASLFGEAGMALLIDFASLEIQPVPLALESGWRLVVLDSGEPRALAASGYNERRAECARACAILNVDSLRELERDGLGAPDTSSLPATLARRVRHVLSENARVRATVAALHEADLERVGELLDESHASLRDDYDCSTPAVEAAVARLKSAGAAGARMAGGGFGGHVLGLLTPAARAPAGSRVVLPARGARLLA